MWYEHIQNKKAVLSAFESAIPTLEGLRLGQIVLHEVGGLDVALNLDQMPEIIPARWKEKGCDRLQLRFRFSVDDLLIRRRPDLEAPDGWRVSVELDKDWLRIASKDGSFELTAVPFHARLEFYPYQESEFEFELPPRWYGTFGGGF